MADGDWLPAQGSGPPGDGPSVSVSPDIEDVVSVAFGLKTGELRTYRALHGRAGATVGEVAEAVGADRSHVNRSLRRLCEHELARRRRRVLPAGGFQHVYTAIGIEEARRLLEAELETWADRTREQLGDRVGGDA